MPFPPVVDNSMRKAVVKCQKSAYWRYERGLDSESLEHLHAGKAFAVGVEVARKAYFYNGATEQAALNQGLEALSSAYGDFQPPRAVDPWDAPKTKERMLGALAFYFEKFPLDREMKPLGIEMNLLEPIPVAHPETGQDLTYSVRFDFLGEDANGDVWVVDEKTTGLYKGSISTAWAKQWDLDAGLTGYVWRAQKWLDAAELGKRCVGAKIRGIGIGKTDYGSLEITVRFEEWEIERWYKQMLWGFQAWARANENKRMWNVEYDMALDHACIHYKEPCQFAKLCKARDPERLIDGNYRIEFWDPVMRDLKFQPTAV